MSEKVEERRQRLRIPIRYKVLALVSVMLLASLSAYLYLVISLFSRDRIVYTFDLNSTLVQTLSVQTQAALQVQAKEILLAARQILAAADDRERRLRAEEFFALEPDYLRLELAPLEKGGQRLVFYHTEALARMGLEEGDLAGRHAQKPLPLEVLSRRPGTLLMDNLSLPHDAAVLRLAVSFGGEKASLAAAADFHHQRLLRIFGRSPTHETFLIDNQGSVLAHPRADMVIQAASFLEDALVEQALAGKVAQAVREYRAVDGRTYLGAFAAVGLGDLYVVTRIPREEALRATEELVRKTVLFALAILLAAFLASVVFSRMLTSPVSRLSALANRVGRGDFEVPVEVYSRDEIGGLARSFRQMLEALKRSQAQLVRSEKMAAYGQLGAGITHEVKNPMTGVLGFAELALKHKNDPAQLEEFLSGIHKNASRCLDILNRFLKFARQEEKQPHQPLEVNELVEEVGKLIKHQALLQNVTVKVNLSSDVPPVKGNPGELQQVLLNMALNAQQAMKGGGTLDLATGRGAEGWAEVRVSDNGPGIPPEIRNRIFEPFFTTKPAGDGTGLGLAIAYSIVSDHRGTIELQTEVGKGTTFTIRLPPLEKSGS